MKRKLFALLPALSLLLSCLTGCGAKAADEFYALSDEITQIHDAQVELILPYHGAELQITGFVSRTNETADLTFTLSGTDRSDGTWTELRIDGNQIWLNVSQLAERTLSFDLPAIRRADILEFRQNQIAAWVNYSWEGDLWDGIPEWEELLTQLWQDSRPDLEKYIKANGTEYTLTLTGKGLERAAENASARLAEHKDAYRTGFVDTLSRQKGLMVATQMEPDLFFDSYWESIVTGENEGETASQEFYEEDPLDPEGEVTQETPEAVKLEAVTVTLAQNEDSYTVSLSTNNGPAARLTLTPTAPQSVAEPEDVMEFRAYLEDVYYLITFSDSYVGDVLDGVVLDENLFQTVDEDEAEPLSPLVTGAALGYDDLATIQFATEGGNFSTVPILTGYTENQVESVNDDGVQVEGLWLNGPAWSQQVYSEPGDQPLTEYLSDASCGYYDAYIYVTGGQLVQDLSEVVQSDDGAAAAQGFSYREHDYAPAFARLLIGIKQPDGAGYTVFDLNLNLDQLTEADRNMVHHLFEYLGLETPIVLDV